MSRTNVSLGRVLAAVVWPWPLAAKTRVESQSTACGMLRCRIRGGAGTGTSPGNSVSDDIRMQQLGTTCQPLTAHSDTYLGLQNCPRNCINMEMCLKMPNFEGDSGGSVNTVEAAYYDHFGTRAF